MKEKIRMLCTSIEEYQKEMKNEIGDEEKTLDENVGKELFRLLREWSVLYEQAQYFERMKEGERLLSDSNVLLKDLVAFYGQLPPQLHLSGMVARRIQARCVPLKEVLCTPL